MSGPIPSGQGSKEWIPLLIVGLLFLLSVAVSWLGSFQDAGTSVLGSVVSADGQPVVGARAYLRVMTRQGSVAPFPADSSVTDSTGCFDLFALHPPGTVEISVFASGHGPFRAIVSHGFLSAEVVMRRAGDQEGSEGWWGPTPGEDPVHARCGSEMEEVVGSGLS